jgi:hypothetical protein
MITAWLSEQNALLSGLYNTGGGAPLRRLVAIMTAAAGEPPETPELAELVFAVIGALNQYARILGEDSNSEIDDAANVRLLAYMTERRFGKLLKRYPQGGGA